MDLIWAVKDERKRESFLCSGIVYTMTIVGVPKKKREKKTYHGQYTSILKHESFGLILSFSILISIIGTI